MADKAAAAPLPPPSWGRDGEGGHPQHQPPGLPPPLSPPHKGEGKHAVKPLQGIRVIDVSSFLAGPFCSTQLAEFGAEVFKIELPGVGDPLRKFGTITQDRRLASLATGDAATRRSATLDLRKPEGAELLKR